MNEKNSTQSMTGFCSVEGEVTGKRVRLEIKSLNHRFLDLKVKLPKEFLCAEFQMRSLIQSRFNRGAIDVRLERAAAETPTGDSADVDTQAGTVDTNFSLAAGYYEALISIRKTLGLNDPIRTVDIAMMPDVMIRGTAAAEPESIWKGIEPLVEKAVTQVRESRVREGKQLTGLVLDLLDQVEKSTHLIKNRRAECQEDTHTKLKEKAKKIWDLFPTGQGGVDPVMELKVSQELALLLERSDIEEEISRIYSHIELFRSTLKAGGAVGRKLDFVLQELHREVNTTGSKSHDFTINETVVQMKVHLEQIREQVMNLE